MGSGRGPTGVDGRGRRGSRSKVAIECIPRYEGSQRVLADPGAEPTGSAGVYDVSGVYGVPGGVDCLCALGFEEEKWWSGIAGSETEVDETEEPPGEAFLVLSSAQRGPHRPPPASPLAWVLPSPAQPVPSVAPGG